LVASVSKRSGGFAARHPISDGSAFNELKKLVDSEGANLAGPDWLGMLAAIGIIKGQPFTPDAHSREILNQAAKTGYKTSRVIGFQEVVSGRSLRVYSDRRWLNPFADGTHADPTGVLNLAWENVAGGYLDLDARIWMFTDYYSASPGMVSQNPGKGAMYVIGFTDSEGAPLVGGSNYRLSLPASIPAANFWSVTALRGGECSGSRQRPAVPLARFARQACAERRRQHGPLSWAESAQRQRRQLARHGAR
jgi:hypothetical protein